MKKITCLLISIIVIFLLTACSGEPTGVGDGSDSGGKIVPGETQSENDKGNHNGDGTIIYENKYANIQKIVAAYDDVYIYQNYNGTYGLLSTDGNIIYEGFYLYQEFSEFSNYLSCRNRDNNRVGSIIDRNGITVLSVGENNIEFISEITQGRILAYQMTNERPSGKIYDLICYSAKDMSEVFRLSNQDTILSYIGFDKTGYADCGDICFDIYGNIYLRSEKNGFPKVSGIAPIIDINAWTDLAESYSEYKNSPTRDYEVGATKNTLGQIATLYMKNTSEWSATMDMNGNILMPPTKDILLKYDYYLLGTVTQLYCFSNDLCCAYQPSSGLWGYVDPYGNWKVAPQYDSVTTFSYAGYAVVDDLVVIDTTGKIVFDISDRGDVHPLEGKYKLSGAHFSTYLTFSKDGTVVANDGLIITGTYEIHGDALIVEDLGYSSALSNGTHTFEQSGDTLIIDGRQWILQETQ